MKTLHRILLTTFGFALALVPGASSTAYGDAAGHNEVRLDIALGSGKGRVLCGVYDKSGWLKRPLRAATTGIRGNMALCRFSDLRPGTYAVGAFQDVNLNGRLDRSWTGGAAEPWCVSRESRGTIGAPSFDSASFRVGEGTVAMRCRAR